MWKDVGAEFGTRENKLKFIFPLLYTILTDFNQNWLTN